MHNVQNHNPISRHFDQLKDRYSCPITLHIMNDPVVTKHGRTYERAAITTWFLNHSTDPITRAELPNMRDSISGIELPGRPDTTLCPEDDLRRSIQDFLAQHDELQAYIHNQELLLERLQAIEDSYCHYNFKRCTML